MKKYLGVVEKPQTGFSAFSPDLDGCIATGKTIKEIDHTIQEGEYGRMLVYKVSFQTREKGDTE